MSRGRIVIAVLCVLTAIFAYFFWRDLRLPLDIVPRDLPDLIVENFSFKRSIGDREWSVAAVSAEHKSGVVTAVSVDLLIDEVSPERHGIIFAQSGDFTRDDSEMLLYLIDGSISTGGTSADITAPVGSYDATLGTWQFPQGMEFYDTGRLIRGNAASADRSGNFRFWKGVSASWVME